MGNRKKNSLEKKYSLFSEYISIGKIKLLNDYLIPGNVLDIGSGNGMYGLYLESKGCNVLQIDLLDRRNEKAQHLQFKQMDAQNLKIEHYKYNDVIAFDIIEHLDDDIKFLNDVRRICEGRLFISVPNSEDVQVIKIGLTHIHHKDKTHRREYSKEQLETILANCGFKILELRPNYAPISNFARVMAKDYFLPKVAAKIINWQCKAFIKLGLFENRTVGDWYCVAE